MNPNNLHVYPAKSTGVCLRDHDPAYDVNRAVPEGQVALGYDFGWTTGNPATDPPPDTYEVVLLTGTPQELLDRLLPVVDMLRRRANTP